MNSKTVWAKGKTSVKKHSNCHKISTFGSKSISVTHESAFQQVIDQMKFSSNKDFVFLLKNLFSAKNFTHDVEASLWHMPLRFLL